MVDQMDVTPEDIQAAQSRRRFALNLEMQLLNSVSEAMEGVATLHWPDRVDGVAGEFDRATLDAIRDNLPGHGDGWPPYKDLQELKDIRHCSRLICTYNEYAKGAIKNRCNFVVGFGHTISIVAKPGMEISETEKGTLSGIVKDFERRTGWRRRQRATQRRLDRDGEVFRRKFVTNDGVELRFIEPEDICPPDDEKEAAPFGIIYATGDVETPVAYWVRNGESWDRIDAELVQHIKLDDDMDLPRGIPLLMACRGSLGGAAGIQRNTNALTKIQSHYAVIRKRTNAVMQQISDMVARTADVSVKKDGVGGGQEKYGREYGPGGVYDTDGSVEYEFPSQQSKPENFLPPKDSALRAAAASIVMSEYMLTADASNSAFASTMVAESPPTREFEAAQWDLIEYDRPIIEQELAIAVARGVISQELLDRVEVKIDPPAPSVRNQKEMAEVRTMDKELGVSVQTLMAESGRDYETEMANNEDHIERTGGVPGPSMGIMNNQPPPEPKVKPTPQG